MHRVNMEKNSKVCVTGGAGYLGSFLIKQLLERGYVVHATLRDLGDESKVGLLKSLVHADTRLKLFEADIYKPDEFAFAVEGCKLVVHMATPLQHYADNSKYKSTSEAAVAGVKHIMESCIRSKTVKKLIYTASVVAASPLIGDGSRYKEYVDETCWTPLNLSIQHSDEFVSDYVHSKTLAEQEVLDYNGKGIQVVSLACGLVGGCSVQTKMAESIRNLISQALNDRLKYQILRYLEELVGKVPLVHIEDVTQAHIFTMENPNINGRFLCASDFLKTSEIASLIRNVQPNITIAQGFIEDTKRETKWNSRKLEAVGFEYKCDAKKTISDSLLYARNMGHSL